MVVVEDALTGADFARIATLHVQSIDDSLPALLGPAYAERLYRYLSSSSHEHLVCERVDGRIESACVVSDEPGTLQARIARATPLTLAGAAARAGILRADFRRWLVGFLRDAFRGGSEPPEAPEITYIFTNSALRGQQLGSRLIGRIDALLRERKCSRYWVKTLEDPENRAIAFYERSGFVRCAVREEAGRRFVVFHKDLEPGTA